MSECVCMCVCVSLCVDNCTIKCVQVLIPSLCNTCRPSQPLDGFTVVIIGKLSKTTAALTKTIKGLGGSVVKDVDSSTNLCISSKGVCMHRHPIVCINSH